jgi:hypothetical protein
MRTHSLLIRHYTHLYSNPNLLTVALAISHDLSICVIPSVALIISQSASILQPSVLPFDPVEPSLLGIAAQSTQSTQSTQSSPGKLPLFSGQKGSPEASSPVETDLNRHQAPTSLSSVVPHTINAFLPFDA